MGPAVDVDRGPPERPALAFRLAEADPAPEAAEVDVVGDLRRRKVAVVETACGILWPAGKLISPYRTVLRALPRRTDAASEPAAPPEPPPVLLPVPTMGGLPPLPRASSTRRGDRSRSRSARRPHSCPSQSSSPCRSSSRTSSSPAQQLRCPGDLGTGGSLASQRGVPVRLPAAFERGPIDLTIDVLQFASDVGAGRYDAQRLAFLCSTEHHRLDVPEDTGASAVGFTPTGGRATASP